MIQLEKVIFDTNVLRNIEPKTFLGGRDELKKFSKVAEIIFPDIVIEELKCQKLRNLKKQKENFLKNSFHWLMSLDVAETKRFDREAYVNELEKKEDIKYTSIKLSDYSVLEKIKNLALRKKAPFEKGNNTDKGFKDAYIYFTILEYIQQIAADCVFVCTGDGRLKEALEECMNIVVVKDYEEFKKKSITSFYNDYFIERLREVVSRNISKDCITDYSINIQGNMILLVDVDENKYVIETDSGEIIGYKNIEEYYEYIDRLINSGDFGTTHSTIAHLENYKNFLLDEEILKILEAAGENNQIYYIAGDGDVRNFLVELFDAKKDILNEESRYRLESIKKLI